MCTKPKTKWEKASITMISFKFLAGGCNHVRLVTTTQGQPLSQWWWEGDADQTDWFDDQPDQLLVHQCQA